MTRNLDPSVDGGRAHLLLAFACAPFVATGIGALGPARARCARVRRPFRR